MIAKDNNESGPGRLVNGDKLLEMLFDEASRPSKRWLGYQIAARSLPFIKIGAKVFFDLDIVRAKLAKKNTVGAN